MCYVKGMIFRWNCYGRSLSDVCFVLIVKKEKKEKKKHVNTDTAITTLLQCVRLLNSLDTLRSFHVVSSS
jgi:hypothetical protein